MGHIGVTSNKYIKKGFINQRVDGAMKDGPRLLFEAAKKLCSTSWPSHQDVNGFISALLASVEFFYKKKPHQLFRASGFISKSGHGNYFVPTAVPVGQSIYFSSPRHRSAGPNIPSSHYPKSFSFSLSLHLLCYEAFTRVEYTKYGISGILHKDFIMFFTIRFQAI